MADYKIVFNGMKDYVKRALPPNNVNENLAEYLDLSFDKNLQDIYNLLKNVWTLRDPMEVDEKFLFYLSLYYNIKLEDIPFDTFKQREVVKDLVYLMKEKGTFASIYAIYKMFAEENPNILSIIERWHTNDWSSYPKNIIIDPNTENLAEYIPSIDYNCYWTFLYAYNNWHRSSHHPIYEYDDTDRWSYKYNSDSIYTERTYTFNFMVSDERYEDYKLTATLKADSETTGYSGVILAFATDDDWDINAPISRNKIKKEHTLTAVRSPGGISKLLPGTWQVYYNFRKHDEKLIAVKSDTITWGDGSSGANVSQADYNVYEGFWSDNPFGTIVSVCRQGDIIKLISADFGDGPFDAIAYGEPFIEIDLNSDENLEKFKGPKRIGFGAYEVGNATYDDVNFVGEAYKVSSDKRISCNDGEIVCGIGAKRPIGELPDDQTDDEFRIWEYLSVEGIRYTHHPIYEYDDRDKWYYDFDNKTVISEYSFGANGIVSPKTYSSYDFRLDVKADSIHDGHIGFVMAFNVEEGWSNDLPVNRNRINKEHTLTAVRSPGGISKLLPGTWQVYYNFRKHDEKLIMEKSEDVLWGNGSSGRNLVKSNYDTFESSWSNYPDGCVIKTRRRDDDFRVSTSNLGSSSLESSTVFEFNLADYPDLKEIFGGGSGIGVAYYDVGGVSFDNTVVSNTVDSGEYKPVVIGEPEPEQPESLWNEIYNEWYRFSHHPIYVYDNRQLWTYDSNVDSVRLNGYANAFTGFSSHSVDGLVDIYDITIKVKSDSMYDGYIGFVICGVNEWTPAEYGDGTLTRDIINKEHTLTAVRSPGGISKLLPGTWQVYYNFRKHDEKLIAVGNSTVLWGNGSSGRNLVKSNYDTFESSWSDYPDGCVIRVKRVKNDVLVQTSDLGSGGLKTVTSLNIDLAANPYLQKFNRTTYFGIGAYNVDDAYFELISNDTADLIESFNSGA